MNVVTLPSTEAIAELAAKHYVEVLTAKPDAVLGFATGSSPLPTYNRLVELCDAGDVSFADARGFLLDEYAGLPKDHPQNYRTWLNEQFISKVNFQEGAVQGPEGDKDDPFAAAAKYEKALVDAGGVDFQILGIGTDGHIAFNEPGGSLSSLTHPQVLNEQTLVDNARFFDGDVNQVPKYSITQGLGTILRAKDIILIAQGEQKAEAIAAMVEGGVSVRWPASVLQFHNSVTVILDEAAASQLKEKDFYQYVWEREQELRA